MTSTLHVTSLYIYPIKSCCGIAVDNAVLTECGLQWDRYWVIVKEEDRKILTQRTHPKMVLIRPRLDVDANQVTGVWKDATVTTIHASTGPIDAVDLGDEAAQWVSQFLECRGVCSSRLVHLAQWRVIYPGIPLYSVIYLLSDNDHEFYVASRCPRCTLPNVDPDEGVALKREPFNTLQSYRRVDSQFKWYYPCRRYITSTD
ncbi:hypothetical protein BDF22DRAFT_656367 [Syncephalis plumigaleata]|nr:hypothetical protein BDF22DRAFT_656367 [Syncephalis plumigaleata]